MGLFFESKQKETGETSKAQSSDTKDTRNSMGAVGTISVMIVGLLIDMTKSLVALMDRPSGPKANTIKLTIIACLLAVVLLYIYKIPAVRDGLSLSATHTNNLSSGGRIQFPHRSHFTINAERTFLQLEKHSNITYITYSGYTPDVSYPMSSNECHLVPREEMINLAASTLPVYAAGFEDTVWYVVSYRLSDAPLRYFLLELILDPRLLFASKQHKEKIISSYRKKGTWREFKNDWKNIWAFESGKKPFVSKALSNEHAMACF